MTKNLLTDSYGRRVNYLRVSLTEQCNFRCLYCVPQEGFNSSHSESNLPTEALIRFVRVAAGMGIHRIRLTGGEPLLRRDLPEIISEISQIPQIQDLSLTTNGYFLKSMASALRKSGLNRINLSLDSLEVRRFHQMTRSEGYRRVWEGLAAALDEGIPVKINVVILKGLNEGEILPFTEFALEHGLPVRFLEFMPLCGSGWNQDLVYPVAEMRDQVSRRYHMTEEARGDAPAQTFRISDGRRWGRVGFIGPLSEPFCDTCSRIRLTAGGNIQPCLFSGEQFPIAEAMAAGVNDLELAVLLQQAVWQKSRGSKYFDWEVSGREESYLEAYQGRESENPLIHHLGG